MKKLLLTLLLLPLLAYPQTWVTVGSPGFSGGATGYNKIAVDTGGIPYVVYESGNDSAKATVMKYNGINWVSVGTPGFSAERVLHTSIAIDRWNTPYVVYQNGNSGKTTVMKYDAGSWVTVGSPGFSADSSSAYTSIAIDSSGIPYVVYRDGAFGRATVMKYNGSSWVTVGSARFSAGAAYTTSIAIDRAGTPYVVYEDFGNSQKATVMKYDGISWVTVGSPGFSAGRAECTNIAIDSSGTPYVVYSDGTDSEKTTVMKYDGSNWAPVGSAGFSAGWAKWQSIAIDRNGTPYVVYADHSTSNSGQTTVMKYNGSSWVTVGNAGFSLGSTQFTSIAIDKNGAPYVAYEDLSDSGKATVMKLDTSLGLKNTVVNRIINIYPNPTTAELTISASERITSISITNLLGQTVHSHDYNSQQVKIDVADLPKGIYVVKVNSSEVRNFVKE